MSGWKRLERIIWSSDFDFSCFAFGAAVMVFCFDQVEEFELF